MLFVLSSADSAFCLCVVLLVGVHITHSHHWRSPAGHGDWAVLRCFRTNQRSGCHALLLSAEHLLQEGNSFSHWDVPRYPCTEEGGSYFLVVWCETPEADVCVWMQSGKGSGGNWITVIRKALTLCTWLLLSWLIIVNVNTKVLVCGGFL